MDQTTQTAHLEAIPVPRYAWLVLALAVFAILTLALDNGIVLQAFAERVHEFVHDGRHLLGVPCH